MIYDIITYNGERELFEIRYNILKDLVNEFRVFEFDRTFSGRPKGKQFNQNLDKVKHYFITEYIWSKYKELAKFSPNTGYGQGAEHWLTEFAQKECIRDYLTDLLDSDIIYIGDIDEIWKPTPVSDGIVFKLKLKVYTYWLNNRSSEEFWGCLCSPYKFIKNFCLNDLRNNAWKTVMEGGWLWYFAVLIFESFLFHTYNTLLYDCNFFGVA